MFPVQFPRGQDANEFALKQQPATHWLGMYLQRAAWLGKGQRPTVAVIEPQPVKPQAAEPGGNHRTRSQRRNPGASDANAGERKNARVRSSLSC